MALVVLLEALQCPGSDSFFPVVGKALEIDH
jgi:hypothetical protein